MWSGGSRAILRILDLPNSTSTLPIFTALLSLLKGEKTGKIGAKTNEDIFLEKRFFQRKTSEDLFYLYFFIFGEAFLLRNASEESLFFL